MEQIDLKHLIEQYPEVLIDSAKLKSYILDLYPSSKRGIVKVLVAIQQCGIVAEMQTSKNPSALDMSRWKKVLDDDYGFTGETAETCLQMWCSAIGVQLEIKASAEQKANTVRSKVQNDNSQNKQSSVEVGDIYTFGAYQQDNNTSNDKQPIKWLVLAKEDNKILLISEQALDCQPYNTSYDAVRWEICTLREWLNDAFLNTAFSVKEQKRIAYTFIPTDKILPYGYTSSENVTKDRIFLLNSAELDKYLKYISSAEARKCVPTAFAGAKHAYTSTKYTKGGCNTCFWWLRLHGCDDQGNDWRSAGYVFYDGSVDFYGISVNDTHVCVRPALWVNLTP